MMLVNGVKSLELPGKGKAGRHFQRGGRGRGPKIEKEKKCWRNEYEYETWGRATDGLLGEGRANLRNKKAPGRLGGGRKEEVREEKGSSLKKKDTEKRGFQNMVL